PVSLPQEVQLGPDGLLWVLDTNSRLIARVHPDTGAFVQSFLQAGDGPDFVSTFLVTPDGLLYVARYQVFGTGSFRGEVLRYDAVTGTPLPGVGQTGARFVAQSAFQLGAAMAVDPAGDLYVSDFNQSRIFAFDGTTGAARGTFVDSNLQTNG